MKGTTVYSNSGKPFAIWQAHLRNEMPAVDGKANPMLWWTKCLTCHDYIVCGVDTKREAIEFTLENVCCKKETQDDQ